MVEHEWTAEDIFELVKDWPVEAKVEGAECRFGYIARGAEWYAHGMPISTHHTALIHAASGIEWLAVMGRNAYGPTVTQWPDHGTFGVVCYMCDGSDIVTRGYGPTLLHAVSYAVMAVV